MPKKGTNVMGRKKLKSREPTQTTNSGLSNYQAVERLVEFLPDISRRDIASRLKADGIDLDVDMASAYASKVRKEFGLASNRNGKRGRASTAIAAARADRRVAAG
jgi:hypothetical protein